LVLAIFAKRIVRVLIMVVLFLTLAGLLARVAEYAWGSEGLLRPLTLFDVGAESNIPTWFSSLELLLSSVLLAAIALASKRGGGRYGRHWGVLSLIFLLLSVDEGASIHEAMGVALERLLHNSTGFEASGFISSFWVVPGAALMLEAQVISVFGGEANGGGLSKIVVGLLTDVEEMFELLGIAVFVYALLAYMGAYAGNIHVRVRIDKPG
jgi:hypothetical protein